MVEEISPSQIRRQRFEMVRRGFDPQEVGAFLERVAERLAVAERSVEEAQSRLSSTSHELEDAKAAEEALQLTMVAATQAKDEMLARAKAEAEEARSTAQREAEAVVAEARRQAGALIEESRHDAGGVVTAARGEHGELLAQVDQLREVVSRVRQMLSSVAGSIDPALERAEQMLADPSAIDLHDEDDDPRWAEEPAAAIVEDHDEHDTVGEGAEAEGAHDGTEAEGAHDGTEAEGADANGDSDDSDEEHDFDVVSSPPTLEVVADVDEDEDVVAFDTDDAESEALPDTGNAAASDEPVDDEASEVERLLRQLRGG